MFHTIREIFSRNILEIPQEIMAGWGMYARLQYDWRILMVGGWGTGWVCT